MASSWVVFNLGSPCLCSVLKHSAEQWSARSKRGSNIQEIETEIRNCIWGTTITSSLFNFTLSVYEVARHFEGLKSGLHSSPDGRKTGLTEMKNPEASQVFLVIFLYANERFSIPKSVCIPKSRKQILRLMVPFRRAPHI